MRWLAERLVRVKVAWAVVIGTILLAGVSAFFATQVPHDDDVLAFLPRSDPDVAIFYDINRRFGGLDVALVGVQTEDVLAPDFFAELADATKALDESPSIDFALSLANVDDFVPSPDGGIETDLLVRSIPADDAARQALRDKVLSRDLVVGQLVSSELDAALVLVFPAEGSDPRGFANEVQATVARTMPSRRVAFGGAPFVSSYVFEATQADLALLTPWAVAAIVLMILIGFRDPLGAIVVLFSTGAGIAVSMALMFVLGVEHNIVLSSMPVIAFSVGSAYGLHVLARYQQLRRTLERDAALVEALVSVGPTVVAAGLTTVAGLFSFLAMNIVPMQTFGLFTGLGVLVALVLALTFVPAAIRVAGLTHPRGEESTSAVLVGAVAWLRERRAAGMAVVLAVAAIGAFFAGRVDTRMDLSAFFADDSPPARADAFLLEEFGGSQFVQVHLRADFTSPDALWQLFHLADRIEALDSVSSVQHAGQVVAQLNLAMQGARRVPDEPEQVALLYRFLTGRPAIGQLVTEDRQEVVVHAKLAKSDVDSVERALHDVEAIVAAGLAATPVEIALGRVEVATRRAGAKFDADVRARVRAALAEPASTPRPAAVAERVAKFLASDESPVTLPEAVAASAAAVIVPGDSTHREGGAPSDSASADAARSSTSAEASVVARLVGVLAPHEDVIGEPVESLLAEDLIAASQTRITEAKKALVAMDRAARVRAAVDQRITDPHWRTHVMGAMALLERSSSAPKIEAKVSGLPVLHRGLSRSTVDNQITSLALALVSVLVVLTIAFRSVRAGLLAASPTVITLLAVYGGMGILGVHLDMGTAMLASLIIGAGVDYAVHLVTAWRTAPSVAAAVSKTATAIWTNAMMVGAGFFILTLGEAKTLENVGGLTAAAMLTAALATFVCVPVFSRRGPALVEAAAPASAPEGAPQKS